MTPTFILTTTLLLKKPDRAGLMFLKIVSHQARLKNNSDLSRHRSNAIYVHNTSSSQQNAVLRTTHLILCTIGTAAAGNNLLSFSCDVLFIDVNYTN